MSFAAGSFYTKISDQGEEIQAARLYTEQEVSGLRADWDRDRNEQNRRIEKLEEQLNKD